MTIASEISRIQCAKSDIRQAIIDKGVSISSDLTIDDYACCIDEIPTGSNEKFVDVLVVGGGGGGGGSSQYNSCCHKNYGSGGGGGGVVICQCLTIGDSTNVVIGLGGNGASSGFPCQGCPSCFGAVIALGGGAGDGYGCGLSQCVYQFIKNSIGASGGGGTTDNCIKGINQGYGGSGGYNGGGAGQAGTNSKGGDGKCSDISGECCWYGGGGGGYNSCPGGCGGGGAGGVYNYNKLGGAGGNATYYGGGGGGAGMTGCKCCSGSSKGGNGCQGIVVVRYPTDGSYGITSATGGNTCRTCTISGVEYKIHEFTSDGIFCITG